MDIKNKLHCPRCGNTSDLVVYDETFDCIKCKLEFRKKDLEEFDDEDILSIEELSQLVRSVYSEK